MRKTIPIKTIGILVPVFLVGSIVGIAGDRLGFIEKVGKQGDLSIATRRKGSFQFTNPLLECEQADSTLRVHIRPFDEATEQYITTLRANNPELSNLAIQYRDLLSGIRYTYNESFQFIPASLLKVPVLIAHLKRVEKDPAYLQKRVMFDVNENTDQERNIITLAEPPLELGTEYTIEEYLTHMIVYSSNRATLLLGKLLQPNEVDTINEDLGIRLEAKEEKDLAVNVTDFSSFFRVLYNASYVRPDLSEYALRLMTQSQYKDGLEAGVPPGVSVAHKFGERIFPGQEEHQLHDCGIVYYPKRPYLLCVMTKGKDFSTLQKTIADLSKFFYERVKKQYGE